jgi:hypothetical protein
MRMLFFATAMVALAMPALAAPPLHREVIGAWCQPITRGHVTTYLPRLEGQDCGDEILTVKAHRYEGWEFGCSITAVKTWFDPAIIASTKELGVKVSQIDSICSGEACEWRERITLHVSKGALSLRGIWRSKDKCESK